MRVLLDECMPRDFKKHLGGHECLTVPEAGLGGSKNGELLRAAAGRFEALVTVDGKLRHQQDLRVIPFGVIVLIASGNRYATCRCDLDRAPITHSWSGD